MTKKFFITLATGFFTTACIMLSGCSKSSPDELSHAGHNHNHPEGHIHGNDSHEEGEGSGIIMLHAAEAERFGVKADTLRPGGFSDGIRATGRVLAGATDAAVVAAPTSGIVHFPASVSAGAQVHAGAVIATVEAGKTSGGNPDVAARAALEAAKRELDRLKPLYAEKLVTASDYNAALAAYEQAKAAVSATALSGRATAPVSGIVTSIDVAQGQYVEAGTPIASISKGRSLTLRIDVPQKFFREISSISGARLHFPYMDADETVDIAELGGKCTGNTSVAPTGSTGAYIPVYFTVVNDGRILPESSFDAYLTGASRQGVISVPRTALSEQQGNFFVYEKLDDDCYRKLPVVTGNTDGQSVEIVSGLSSGQVIVTEGAVTVRLAEGAAVAPEGHSHNH